jgi:hypothetical protein
MNEKTNLFDLSANEGVERLRALVAAEDALMSTIDTVTGGVDVVKFLVSVQWDAGDGPQRMTEDEAEAVLAFGHWVIESRKVWPTDSIGAGIKLADMDHVFAPLPEPDEAGHDTEEDAIHEAVMDYMFAKWKAEGGWQAG